MSPWQVLRASRATQAAVGYRVHHASGGSVHYSTAPAAAAAAAAAAAPDSSRSFCLSREKDTLQQLNGRLASYLQQVHCLEAANQKLECQIQEELDKKCPGELRELDRHLRTVSLLQDQMTDCLSAQAQVKLQLLSAELTVFDLNIRSEKERERRGRLEAELSDLRLLEEELQVHKLPELHSLLNDQSQQLMGLQIQHQQDMQVVLSQMSGGVTMEMHPTESLDLIQQLDDLRHTSVALLDKNQSERWFNTQVSMLSSPEVTFDPLAESEVIQVELEELRRTAAGLEEELRQLQALNMVLESSGLDQNESFVEQLEVLQQRADSLCWDLDSVLQATHQQAADNQTLLDITIRLETEIQDYRRLLDGLSPKGVSSLHPNSVANATSFCVSTSPSPLRRNFTVNKTASVQGGSLKMTGVQAISRGHIYTVGQTPIGAPLSQTVTTVQSIRVHGQYPNNTPVTSINTPNRTSSFQKSENQRTGAIPERTARDSISVTINRQSSPVEDKDRDLRNSSIVSTQISQGIDQRVVDKDSKLVTNTAQGTTKLVPETQSIRSAEVQAKPETFTSKPTSPEAVLQANKTETNIQTEITRTILCAEPEVKQGSHSLTHTTTTDHSKKETKTVVSAGMICTERSIEAKNQDPAEVVSLSLKTPTDAVGDAGEIAISGSSIATASSGSPHSNDNVESKTTEGTITLVPEKESVRSAPVQAKPETFASEETSTEADLEATQTETNIQTMITRTLLCAEPEVKQGPDMTHMTISDPSHQTAAEVKKETETVISTQINCTEGSIQAKNQESAQVVSLSLQSPTEAVRDAGEFMVTASVVSESQILRSEEAQDKVSGDLTLMDEEVKRQEKKQEDEVGGTLLVSSEENTFAEDADTRSSVTTTSSSSPDSNVNLESKMAQGTIALVPDTQSVRSATVEAKPETFASEETSTEADLEATQTETNIQTMVTRTLLCAEPEVKQGPDMTHMTISDPSKQTAAEVKKETETVISTQINCTEGSIQAKNQESAQVVSLSLQSPTEAVRDAGEFVVTASVVSESQILRSEEAQDKVSGDLTLMDEEVKRQEKKQEDEVGGTLLVSSEENTFAEDADTRSSVTTTSSSSPDSNVNLESKMAQGTIALVPDTQSVRCATVEAKPETFASEETSTEADLEATQTETNIQTMVTRTLLCAEPEVKQGPDMTHMTISDPSKQTAAEVKKETETVISTQINCTEGSIQAKNQESAQVVSLSLKSPTEAVRDAGEFVVTASVVSESQILRSEEAQDKVSGDLTLMDEEVKRQEKKQEDEVGGTLLVSSEENTFAEDADTRSSVTTTSSSSPDSNVNLESKMAQGTIALVPDTQSVRSATVEAKPETFASEETSTEADLEATQTETNIQTMITRTLLCAEPEVKQGPDMTHMTISDPSKQTAAEVKKETETVISTQINCTEGSIQAKNQESAQVVSLSLKSPTEAVRDAGEFVVTASVVSESQILRSEEAQDKVSGDLTLMDNKEVERQEKKGEKEVVEVESTLLVPSLDQSSALSNASNSELDKVIEDADTGSDNASASTNSPDSNFESKTASTESLMKVELDVDKGKVVNSCDDTNETKVNSTELDNQSKKCTGQTDSSVALSSSDSEELLNPTEVHVSASPTKPDKRLSPVEKELLMSTTDLKELVRSPDSLLSPNDSEQCFGPVEANMCLSPDGEEEDEEVCLSITEANADVRPVEKYILSTKEEGQSLSFGKDQALPEQDRKGKLSNSVRDGDSLCFGSFEGNKESRGTVNGPNNSKPTGQGIGLQLGGTADNKAGQYPGGSPEARYVSENQNETSKSASFGSVPAKEGSTISSVATNSGSIMTSNGGMVASSSSKVSGNAGVSANAEVQGTFQRSSGELTVYGGILGHKSTSLPKTGSKESLSGATSQQERGRFNSRGSVEWMVYGSSLGRMSSQGGSTSLIGKGKEKGASVTPNPATNPQETVRFGSRGSGSSLHRTRSEESPSVLLATGPPEKGRFGSEGSGEWRVYGGSAGRISSWSGSNSLTKANMKDIPSDAAKLPTSPPGSQGGGRFSSGGSGDWRIYGGSSGRMSSWPGSNNLPKADREDITSVAAKLPTSPPGSQGAGRFGSAGSGGSGEWRVYGGSSGRMSSWPGSKNLPKAGREEIPADSKLVTSPPGSVGGRFSSGGSGEWRVYGGSSGRLSSASSADRVSGTSRNQIISPPSSHTSGGQRLSSVGRLSSGGVVRRSSSVGSGGRLSSSGSGGRLSGSSGSHRTSTSGRYASTGSGEWKPVYSSASAHRSSVGSTGRPGGGGAIGSQRAPSPGGKMSVSMGSSSSSGSGRTNSTGGRVISSSDWPIRSTGSGAGGNKERISVCKMAALSISAAGRERSQDRQRQQQQPQQKAAGTSPLLQRWLSTGFGVKSAGTE